jgi:hypothetical protein
MHLGVRGRQEPTSHLPPIFLFSFPRKITHTGPCRRGPTTSARTIHHRVQHQNFLPAFPLEKKITLPLGKAEEEQKELILAMGGIEPPSGRRCWTLTSTTTHATTTPHHLSL